MAKPTHIVHGIPFIRTGECNRCGKCCEVEQCPHFKWIDNAATCLIYEKRDQVCKECSEKIGLETSHEGCINFPNQPWIQVVREGKCNFKFEEIKKDGKSKFKEFNKKWQL